MDEDYIKQVTEATERIERAMRAIGEQFLGFILQLKKDPVFKWFFQQGHKPRVPSRTVIRREKVGRGIRRHDDN